MVTEQEFERFCKVQASGRCNMMDSAVETLACIDRDTHLAILSGYEELAKKYPEAESRGWEQGDG